MMNLAKTNKVKVYGFNEVFDLNITILSKAILMPRLRENILTDVCVKLQKNPPKKSLMDIFHCLSPGLWQ